MGRRWWGALALLVVLLAAVIVPLAAKTYPGTPRATPPAAAPLAGDCLTAPLADVSSVSPAQVIGGSGNTEPAEASVTALGTCGDRRWGEIAAVLPDLPESGWTGLVAGSFPNGGKGGVLGTDPLPPVASFEVSDQCAAAARAYLGLGGGDGRLAGLGGVWFAAAPVTMVVVGPGPRQVQAGQRWSACTLVVLDQRAGSALDQDLSAGSPGTRSFTGTLRSAFATGRMPPQLAGCTGDLGLVRTLRVDCAGAHPAEDLAYATTEDPSVTQTGLDTDCRAIARRVLHRPDPTAGGVLTVTAVAGYTDPVSGETVPLLSHTIGGWARCRIAPTDPRRELVGPLAGLGAGAPPLT